MLPTSSSNFIVDILKHEDHKLEHKKRDNATTLSYLGTREWKCLGSKQLQWLEFWPSLLTFKLSERSPISHLAFFHRNETPLIISS